MYSLPKPVRHRAIIVTFGPSNPRDSAVKLHDALAALTTWGGIAKGETEEALANRMRYCVLSMDSDEGTGKQFSKALDDLREAITDAEEKIIIYYGGHALQYEPKKMRKLPVQPNWKWHA